MTNIAPSNRWPFAFIVGLALILLTVPSMLINYGMNGDAWRGPIAAKEFVDTGTYVPSRLPGNPLFEYVLAIVSLFDGYILSNMLVLACYPLCIAAFLYLIKDRDDRPVLFILFAFTPIFLVNASSTIDYMPGLALTLWSYVLAKQKRYVWAYFLVALSIGFRLPNVLFVVPLAIYSFLEGERPHRIVLLSVLTIGLGFAFYAPILAKFGTKALTVPAHSYTGIDYFFFAGYKLIMVFGPIAAAGIAFLLISRIGQIARRVKGEISGWNSSFLGELSAVAVFFLVFLRHADQSSYLIPAIPFFYLLLSRWLNRKQLVAVTALVLSFSFISMELKGGESGRRRVTFEPQLGIVLKDYVDRKELEALRKGVSSFRSAEKAVILHGYGPVLGHLNDQLALADNREISSNLVRAGISEPNFIHKLPGRTVYFVSGMSADNVRILQREGYSVFCFSDSAPSHCMHTYGYDPYTIGITKLDILKRNAFYKQTNSASKDDSRI